MTFCSDYGLADEFVGVCHAVIARIAPAVRVLDIAHGLRGIRAGAALLAQALPYAPEDAVHLAVVDPGVGTIRRAVVVSTASGALLVGPDNGLLPEAADALAGASSVFELQDARYRLQPVSPTFHGRDVFAPAAAHLALGVHPSELGPPLDPASLVRLEVPHVRVSAGELVSDVLREDAFGNVQLAATANDLARAGLDGPVEVEGGDAHARAIVGRTFADARAGDLVVLVDSSGHVAIAASTASAAAALGSPSRVRLRGLTGGQVRGPLAT